MQNMVYSNFQIHNNQIHLQFPTSNACMLNEIEISWQIRENIKQICKSRKQISNGFKEKTSCMFDLTDAQLNETKTINSMKWSMRILIYAKW